MIAFLRFVRNGSEPLVALAVVVGLRQVGLAGDVPLAAFALVLLLSAINLQPRVQCRLAGRLWLRIPLHIALTTTTMYLLGWGPLLAVAHVHILAVHLRASGSRAWRPAAWASAGSIALGQVLVGAGVLPSLLAVRQSHGLALLAAFGSVTTARLLGHFVAQRERAESAARLGEQRLRALLRDGSEVITMGDADGTIAYASPAALPVMGYRPEQLRGTTLAGLLHPGDEAAAADLRARVAASDSSVEHFAELRVRHADGSWRWHEIIARNMIAHPAVRAVVSHQRDITERREAQDRIAYAAAHDPLTGLVNALTLTRDLDRALAQGTRYRHPVAVLFCDLDGFKAVNDTYGHAVGDRLLQAISGVIRRTIRDSDVAGRLGGDEFAVVLTRVNDDAEALAVARRIIAGIAGHASVAGLRPTVGCSIGVALAYPGGTDTRTLMRHADAAMYQAKRRGRNGTQLSADEGVLLEAPDVFAG